MRAVDVQPSQRVVLELSKLKLRQREIKIWCENKQIQQFSRLMVFNSISASGEVPAEEKGSTQTEIQCGARNSIYKRAVHTLRRVQLNKLATKSAHTSWCELRKSTHQSSAAVAA
jgi:hypothetical protein